MALPQSRIERGEGQRAALWRREVLGVPAAEFDRLPKLGPQPRPVLRGGGKGLDEGGEVSRHPGVLFACHLDRTGIEAGAAEGAEGAGRAKAMGAEAPCDPTGDIGGRFALGQPFEQDGLRQLAQDTRFGLLHGFGKHGLRTRGHGRPRPEPPEA